MRSHFAPEHDDALGAREHLVTDLGPPVDRSERCQRAVGADPGIVADRGADIDHHVGCQACTGSDHDVGTDDHARR